MVRSLGEARASPKPYSDNIIPAEDFSKPELLFFS